MKDFVIGKNEAGQRADKLIVKILPTATKGFIYKMIRKKNITLNDSRMQGNEILNEGDVLKLWLSDETIEKFSVKGNTETSIPRELKGLTPTVIFEDDDIIVFNKPSGLLSQKARPEDISLNDYLLKYLIDSNQLNDTDLKTFKPSICNRLDRNTSGLIVCGKSLKGLQDTAEELKNHECKKDYIAVVNGVIDSAGAIEGYLSKDDKLNKVEFTDEDKGDYIKTYYKPVWSANGMSGLMVRIITGKTHQIRASLSSLKHPIIGDVKYDSRIKAKRLMLHAYRLTLKDGRVFEAPIPEDFIWEHSKPGDFEDLPSKI